MEPTQNLNPSTPKPSHPRLTKRGVGLILSGLVLATALVYYSGGFNQLSRIFGSKAGTSQTLNLAGEANLKGNLYADAWINSTVPANFDNVDIFTSFTGVPDFTLPEATSAGFIMPLVYADGVEPVSPSYRYISPAVDLGETPAVIEQIASYAYLPTGTTITLGYRASNDLALLTTAEITPWTEVNFLPVADNADIQTATTLFGQTLGRYLQLSVSFSFTDTTQRPAMYGWGIQLAGNATDGTEVEPVTDTLADNTINLFYSGGPNVPVQAEVKLLGADLALNPMYAKTNVNLTSRDGRYTFEMALTTGAYTLVITSPTTKPIIAPFMVSAGKATNVALGAFEALAGGQSAGLTGNPADLNHDGIVNTLDAQILFEQYGQ